MNTLKKALAQTSEYRGSREVILRYETILSEVLSSERMHEFWRKYQTDFDYAKPIPFEATIDVAKEILSAIS
jgi:hypothetical protein